MEYQPGNWKRHQLLAGIGVMLLGAIAYATSTYLIFFLDSAWLGMSLGVSLLALSILLIAFGFNLANNQQTHEPQQHSDAVRATRSPALISSDELVRSRSRSQLRARHESNT